MDNNKMPSGIRSVATELIVNNPELEIYAMVASDVFAGDEYCSWFAPLCTAQITYITREEILNSDRLWCHSSDYDEMVESYIDYLADKEESVNLSNSFLETIAKGYVESLPWEKCILLWLDV